MKKDELVKKLTPMQYKVTQQEGTEPPFQNAYWDNKKDGIYVDIVTGEALFSSLDKFDSGTGWPSFSKPIDAGDIATKEDKSLFSSRTEVRSREGDSHLGHVFEDGPGPGGLRYCINSAALRFIPVEKLKEEGFGRYLSLFNVATKAKTNEVALFAGGCFWGVEELIRRVEGVVDVVVGYTGGNLSNPQYEDVSSGLTGHAEAVKVTFDPAKVSYEELLKYFFRLHDPTTLNQQGNDRGSQYRSAIFYTNEEQRKSALKIKEEIDKSGKWKKPVVTEITAAADFFPAEDYHQDYLKKHPNGYTCHYLRD